MMQLAPNEGEKRRRVFFNELNQSQSMIVKLFNRNYIQVTKALIRAGLDLGWAQRRNISSGSIPEQPSY
jgi:hypothetical protein